MNEPLRNDFLEVLHEHTREAGMTYAEVGRKWGEKLLAKVDAHFGEGSAPASPARKVKDLAYELWAEGVDLMEPPKGRQTAPRLRHPDFIAKARKPKTESVAKPGSGDEPAASPDDIAALKKTYQTFLSQHPSGAVNIYKIRRKLGWERNRFDHYLRELSARKNPPFQFVGGDPHDFSADQQKDSIFQDGQLYFSILWRR